MTIEYDPELHTGKLQTLKSYMFFVKWLGEVTLAYGTGLLAALTFSAISADSAISELQATGIYGLSCMLVLVSVITKGLN